MHLNLTPYLVEVFIRLYVQPWTGENNAPNHETTEKFTTDLLVGKHVMCLQKNFKFVHVFLSKLKEDCSNTPKTCKTKLVPAAAVIHVNWIFIYFFYCCRSYKVSISDNVKQVKQYHTSECVQYTETWEEI